MSLSKLEKAKKQALVKEVKMEKDPTSYYGEADLLKHFIRKEYWAKRINKLRRDVGSELDGGIKYFTLCSKKAFDVRYFYSKKILNEKIKTSFAFCEMVEKDFLFLKKYYVDKRSLNAKCFNGSLSDIATICSDPNYGEFWGTFPYDVINLDYLGDILKTNPHKVGVNEFATIEKIISQQSLLRRPYEL